MTTKLLFEGIGLKDDKASIVKKALNTLDGYDFPEAVKYFLDKTGYGTDGGGCDFPGDLDEYEIYHDYGGKPFEGVRCYYLGGFEEEEVIVSEEEFFKLLKEACERYITLHPDKKDELEKIMAQSTLI